MRPLRKAGVLAALAATATTCAVATIPAGADVATPEIEGIQNPLTTNIPLLAWKGAEVKLVDCSPAIDPDGEGQEVEFRVQRFSGDVGGSSTTPVNKIRSTERFFEGTGQHAGEGCVKANFDSEEAGLAIIHATVTSDELGQNHNALQERDYIVGWMKLGSPTLKEIAATDPTGSSGVNSYGDYRGNDKLIASGGDDALGDPSGDGVFDAGENNGRFTSSVKGTIPIRSGFFDDDDLGSSITLPDDWAKLATAMATDQDADVERAAAAQRWDIHDDQSTNDVHVPGEAQSVGGPACPNQQAGATVDAVENCTVTNSIGYPVPEDDDGNALGAFSRLFAAGVPAPLTGAVNGDPTIGPFDPLLPDGTLLTDGKLDKDDAPMPPARIDFAIADGGIGSLEPASKPDAYSRDGEAGYLTPEAVGNLYAPFYVQTPVLKGRELLLGSEASGIDSALFTANFPGLGSLPGIADFPTLGSFANYIYPNWAQIVREEAVATGNGCNDQRIGNSSSFSQYQTPEGARKVTVLSDEHGEAQGEFNPGTGFYKAGLSSQPITKNSNGGCDLQGIATLGKAQITATAKYPYHDPQDNSAKVSGAITKTVNNLFDKSVSYWPKGDGAENDNARIVIAHAQGVDGRPLAGERVCFQAEGAGSIAIFQGKTGKDMAVDVQGESVSDPRNGFGRVCGVTDQYGNVALEVFSSKGGQVDVISDYYDEGLLRDVVVDFATPGSSQGPGPQPTPPQQPTNGQVPAQQAVQQPAPAGSPGTTAPSGAVLSQTASGVKVSAARPVAAPKWVVVGKIIRPFGKKAYLRLKASGPAGTVKVRVKVLDKKGRTIRRATVKVAANRTVKVPGVAITSKAKKVRLSIA